jgi:hypothetical protein
MLLEDKTKKGTKRMIKTALTLDTLSPHSQQSLTTTSGDLRVIELERKV